MHSSVDPTVRWPAEWEPQDAILLAWPHAETDWAPVLDEAVTCYRSLVAAIVPFERVLIAAPDPARVRADLGDLAASERVQIYAAPTDDTWTRDTGPLTVLTDSGPRLLDFTFNGWGGKYPVARDNALTGVLHARGAFGTTPCRAVDLVLEGGSVETDGGGTLLTTSRCLLNPNRNPRLGRAGLEAALARHLGVTRVLWLEHGYLDGDDTDGHIDTLARLAPNDTITYIRCDDPADPRAADLAALEAQLRAFRSPAGAPYRLVPLPWPAPRHDPAGHRLPATYANYLVLNGAVIVPTYGVPQDAAALDMLGPVFPERKILGLDARVLLGEHGSVHCATMQLPQGVLP